MFHFQTLDVYKCAVAFLPLGSALEALGDGELASQLCRGEDDRMKSPPTPTPTLTPTPDRPN
jgi:hypothetical protein